MIRLFLTLMLMSLPAAVFAMGSAPSSSDDNSVGMPAPEFTLENTAGKTLTLSEARAGKKTMMFFWATWCPHCHEELERVRQNLDALKKDDVQVLLVNAGETKEEAKAFLKHAQIPLESFVDEDNTVAGLYHVVGIPTVFLIDDKGTLRAVTHEFPSDYKSQF
jgi:cytochrome c biogenesis protein CcmG/thiol:disulfide interchange protein DsbE